MLANITLQPVAMSFQQIAFLRHALIMDCVTSSVSGQCLRWFRERDALMAEITKELDDIALNELGIHVLDVRVKGIDLPPEVSNAVFKDEHRA